MVFLAPVVTDPKKAAAVLREVVSEMERRYDLFASVNARNIKSYNEFVKDYNNGKSDSEQKEILSFNEFKGREYDKLAKLLRENLDIKEI